MLYVNYDTSAGLNYLQSGTVRSMLGKRVPLVYGNDVFVKTPQLLSHKVRVMSGSLIHECIAVVSQGRNPKATVGEIGKIDQNLYVDGIKLSDASVLESKSGHGLDVGYPTHSKIWRTIQITGKTVTIPTKLSDGSIVSSGIVIYKSSTGVWLELAGTPGQTIVAPAQATFISVETKNPTAFPGIATVLTSVKTLDSLFVHPDIYVREGKTVNRLIAAGKGSYTPSSDHIIAGTTTYILDVNNNKSYPLPLTSALQFDYDGDWVVYRRGISDRFPDVVNAIITADSGMQAATINPEGMIEYKSFVEANAHCESLGLKFSGIISDPISIIDFVTDYSAFFDLIPMRDRNRLALIPHTVDNTYISGIFTVFNCSDMVWNFDTISLHDYSSIQAQTSGAGFMGYTGTSKYSEVNTLVLNASVVSKNSDSLKEQIKRIYDSANQQSQSVEVFAPLEFQSLKAGDFIIVDADTFTDTRTHLGGITATKEPGVYFSMLDDIYTAFTVSSDRPNSIIIDSSNRRDSKGRTEYVVGDILVLAISSDTLVYGIVSVVEASEAAYNIKFNIIEWKNDYGDYVTTDKTVTIPKDTIVSFYKIGGATPTGFVYSSEGYPIEVNCKFIVAPTNQRYGQLTVLVKVKEYESVLDATPLIMGSPKLWRVSSIEPISTGFALSAIGDSADAGVRRNEGYRVKATLYPFGTAKTYPAPPPKSSNDGSSTITTSDKSRTDILDYLAEIATGDEFNNVDGVTHIWRPGPITIKIVGTPTDLDTAEVNKVLEELQTLTNQSYGVVPGPAADLTIHFGPESGFSTILPQYVPVNLGFFYNNYNAAQDIVSATVLIDNAKTDQVERQHLIREEMTQTLAGLPDDSYKYADSIFYEPWTKITGYSAIDIEIIKLMAGPDIRSGLTSVELRALIT